MLTWTVTIMSAKVAFDIVRIVSSCCVFPPVVVTLGGCDFCEELIQMLQVVLFPL